MVGLVPAFYSQEAGLIFLFGRARTRPPKQKPLPEGTGAVKISDLIIAGWNRNISGENYKEGIGFTDVYYLLDPTTGDLTSHSVFWDGSFFQANRVTLFCTLIKSGGARFGFWELAK